MQLAGTVEFYDCALPCWVSSGNVYTAVDFKGRSIDWHDTSSKRSLGPSFSSIGRWVPGRPHLQLYTLHTIALAHTLQRGRMHAQNNTTRSCVDITRGRAPEPMPRADTRAERRHPPPRSALGPRRASPASSLCSCWPTGGRRTSRSDLATARMCMHALALALAGARRASRH